MAFSVVVGEEKGKTKPSDEENVKGGEAIFGEKVAKEDEGGKVSEDR